MLTLITTSGIEYAVVVFTDGVTPGALTNWVPNAFDAVLAPPITFVNTVDALQAVWIDPNTSQSPAVSGIDVTLAICAEVSDTPDTELTVLVNTSPTAPADAADPFVMPAMPPVGVTSALKTCAAPHVFAPLRSGIVDPLVPVFAVAAVPRPRFVRAAAALVAPVPP